MDVPLALALAASFVAGAAVVRALWLVTPPPPAPVVPPPGPGLPPGPLPACLRVLDTVRVCRAVGGPADGLVWAVIYDHRTPMVLTPVRLVFGADNGVGHATAAYRVAEAGDGQLVYKPDAGPA